MTASICIFADQNARALPRCIAALDPATAGMDYHAHVMTVGGDYETVMTARALAAADKRLSVHELPVSDRANAWNDYVFRIADPDARVHIFTDASVRAGAGAIAALDSILAARSKAYGASGFPVTGRSRRRWAKRLFLNHYLSGQLYALSRKAVCEFRARDLRLPYGAEGVDGLVSYLLLTDFAGGADDTHKDRIAPAIAATFEFDSLRPSLAGLAAYGGRLARHSERHFQKVARYRVLKEEGAKAMPEQMSDVLTPQAVARLRPRLGPINFWLDLSTLLRLRSA